MPKRKPHQQLSTADQEQQYRIIFEAASDGMIISDIETGRIVDANPAAITMHGFTRDEFIGLHLTSYIHPDSQLLFKQAPSTIQSKGGLLDVPAVHLHKDGTSFYVDVRRTAIPFQSRSCMLSIVRDVTERINAERGAEREEEGAVHKRHPSVCRLTAKAVKSAEVATFVRGLWLRRNARGEPRRDRAAVDCGAARARTIVHDRWLCDRHRTREGIVRPRERVRHPADRRRRLYPHGRGACAVVTVVGRECPHE